MSLRSGDPSVAGTSDQRSSRPWSITGRLTLLYTLSALAMMLAVSFVQYWILVRSVDRHETLLLVDKVRVLGRIVGKAGNDAAIIEHEVRDEGGVYHPEQQYILFSRVLDDDGLVLAETPDMARILPAASFPAARPWSQVSRSVADARLRSPDGRVYFLASVRTPMVEGHGRPRVIQVALEQGGDQAVVGSYRNVSLLVLGLSILLFAAGGAVIARRGMQPLRDMARVAEQITASRLDARLDPGAWPTELTVLAEAFSGMLVRLEESFQRCQSYAEDLAHELRTPIQNLVGEAQVALSRGRTEEEYRHIIESSLEEYERLSRMINELLFLARADDPTTAMGLEPFDVRGELAIVRDYHDAEAEEQGIALTCEGQAWLDADPILFRRVLNNLLSNALRHTPSGGRVVMAARTLAEGVEIAVSDNGCGIAAEHLGKLGTRFYRPDRTASPTGGGVGLGLAIVKSIMALHGGSVAIESAEGQGTKVILRFPFRSISAPQNGGATAPQEPLNSSSVA